MENQGCNSWYDSMCSYHDNCNSVKWRTKCWPDLFKGLFLYYLIPNGVVGSSTQAKFGLRHTTISIAKSSRKDLIQRCWGTDQVHPYWHHMLIRWHTSTIDYSRPVVTQNMMEWQRIPTRKILMWHSGGKWNRAFTSDLWSTNLSKLWVFLGIVRSILTVTDVLPKMGWPWKQTQPTGCSLSHQCPECSG